MSHSPEKNLSKELKKEEEQLHNNLFTLNELFTLCSNPALAGTELIRKATPLIEKFAKSNPLVAKEIRKIFSTQDLNQIKAYLEKEKEELLSTLTTEMNNHKKINRQINREIDEKYPTDS